MSSSLIGIRIIRSCLKRTIHKLKEVASHGVSTSKAKAATIKKIKKSIKKRTMKKTLPSLKLLSTVDNNIIIPIIKSIEKSIISLFLKMTRNSKPNKTSNLVVAPRNFTTMTCKSSTRICDGKMRNPVLSEIIGVLMRLRVVVMLPCLKYSVIEGLI